MDYSDELIGFINKNHLNAETKATHDSKLAAKPNLIDFNDCTSEQSQSTATIASSPPSMANEDILQKQNVRFNQHSVSLLSFSRSSFLYNFPW